MQTERTTLNLPKPLIRRVQKIFGVKTQTEAIVMALEEITRRDRLVELTGRLAGSGGISLTQSQLRRMRGRRNPWKKFL